jgi:hypothetical protein
LKDGLHWPDFIQRIRNRRRIAERTRGQPQEWYYTSLPRANLDRFVADLAELTKAIRAGGAQVVLIAPAVKAGSPPGPADLEELEAARVHRPKPTAQVILEFERAAAAAVLELGRREGYPTVDAAGALSGHHELFGDLVHFNDAGAALVAGLVAERLRPLCRLTADGEDRKR